MQTIEIIQDILREFFDDEDIAITEKTKAADIDGWDSMANVQIMLAIEGAFNTEFSLDELDGFKTIGDITRCIESRK